MIISRMVPTVLIVLVSISAIAKPPLNVILVPPEEYSWVLATDIADESNSLKEWVPKGLNAESTNWLLVEQKLQLGSKQSAKNYLQRVFNIAREACNSVLYNGPEKMRENGYTTYVGRIMCAQQNGKDYGTFTDLRVVTEGKAVFVLTSELRIPPSPQAGTLAFDKGQEKKIQEFMSLQSKSAQIIRQNVQICGANNCDDRT